MMPWTWDGSKHPLVFCNTGNLSTQDFLNASYRMQAYIHLYKRLLTEEKKYENTLFNSGLRNIFEFSD